MHLFIYYILFLASVLLHIALLPAVVRTSFENDAIQSPMNHAVRYRTGDRWVNTHSLVPQHYHVLSFPQLIQPCLQAWLYDDLLHY